MATQPQEDLSADELEAFGLDETPGDDAGGEEGGSDEELARSLGWRPEDEFSGDKEKWVDAATFLENQKNHLGLARKTNERLSQVNRDLTKKLKRAEKMIEQVKGFEDRAYQRALSDLKAQQEQAVEDGDTAKFRALDKEIDDLKASAQKEAKAPKADNDVREVFTEWLIDNGWYNEDTTKRAYADLQFEKLGGIDGFDGTPDELLDEVAKRVEQRFAGKEKPKISRVNGGNAMRVPSKGDATYASLSAEEKQMAQQMVKAGIFKSTDDYAKELRKNG